MHLLTKDEDFVSIDSRHLHQEGCPKAEEERKTQIGKEVQERINLARPDASFRVENSEHNEALMGEVRPV